MSPRDLRIARFLSRRGFVHPYRLVRAARKARITIPTACALVSMETGNGRNIYGHDPVPTGGCYKPGGGVTKANYHCYKRHRGRRHMQGVGPVQLTWWEYQDRADRLGGCWHPYWSMVAGFEILLAHYKASGRNLEAAFRKYNGSGAAAHTYGVNAMKARERWSHELRRAGF